jgi:hypothetical protein
MQAEPKDLEGWATAMADGRGFGELGAIGETMVCVVRRGWWFSDFELEFFEE